VQILTRSGTNDFRGSVFESHRNTALNANNWFNNLRGLPRNVLIRNQYGARLGGPIIKGKTFFHVLYEAQRQRTKNLVTSTTYTEAARNGIFRYFPGVRNGNANSAVATVDLNGSPVRPAAATGELQSINVFGRDPNRMTADRSGVIPKYLQLMPLPNDFRTGDGLNTAGYSWLRPSTFDRDQINAKIDHTFSSRHNANFSYTWETEDQINGPGPQPFPDAPGGKYGNIDHFYSLAVTSTLTPSVVNEFRAGAQRARIRSYAPWEWNNYDAHLPTAGTNPYIVDLVTVTDPIPTGVIDGWGYMAPLYSVSNNLSFIRGRHTFKGGGDYRALSSDVVSAFDVLPRARILATAAVPVVGVTNAAIPGLGLNEADAQSLLQNLAGSVSRVDQAFNSSGPPNLAYLPYVFKNRTWLKKEFSFFFKDDYKVSPSLTLNLGVRYEYYSVPYDKHGLTSSVKGGSAGMFGISGTGFGDMYQPGRRNGSLTELELIGQKSPNPDTKLYSEDRNNFAPAVGLSWSIPWFGKDKTILRMGYGIGYERNTLRNLNIVVGDQPGLRTIAALRPSTYYDLTSMRLSLTPVGRPLETIPLDDRSQILRGYDSNMSTPYAQNWNFSIQRELARDFTLDVRYVGSKGTKLFRTTNLNETNIFENGILDAFITTQAGGNAPLFDQIFQGLNLGLGTIDGRTVTGSASLRSNANTRAFFANNNVGAFANYLNSTTNFTGVSGDLLRRAGLAENFVVVNPQFSEVRMVSNFSNSSYHSMQLDFTKRFSRGYMVQSNFTWSKTLGDQEGDGQELIDSFRNNRNRSLDKRILGSHRTWVARNSGTVELPFGPGRKFLSNSQGFVARLLERWQVGVINNIFSGTPFSIRAEVSSFSHFYTEVSDATAMLVGPMPKRGKVTRVADGVTYFPDLRQVRDPAASAITNLQGLNAASTLFAIADASGRLLVTNAPPGTLGNMSQLWAEGPGVMRFDANLVKRIQISERTEFEIRVDAIDVFNKPQFDAPSTALPNNRDINSLTFGRITSAEGNRIIVLGARLNF
jgi:hypothetical protein